MALWPRTSEPLQNKKAHKHTASPAMTSEKVSTLLKAALIVCFRVSFPCQSPTVHILSALSTWLFNGH